MVDPSQFQSSLGKYQKSSSADVKYAYRNTNWFVETVASSGKVGDYTQFYFDDSDNPIAIYFDRTKKALYASAQMQIGQDERVAGDRTHQSFFYNMIVKA